MGEEEEREEIDYKKNNEDKVEDKVEGSMMLRPDDLVPKRIRL
jgi:hypothetical protein